MSALEWIGAAALIVLALWIFDYVHGRWPVWGMHLMMALADRKRWKAEQRDKR
jgi:hypothetical protein